MCKENNIYSSAANSLPIYTRLKNSLSVCPDTLFCCQLSIKESSTPPSEKPVAALGGLPVVRCTTLPVRRSPNKIETKVTTDKH